MVEIEFFVTHFIEKERQDRWRTLLTSNTDKLYKNLNQLERHLNKDKCSLIEKNADVFYREIILNYSIKLMYYYDLKEGEGKKVNDISYEDINSETLLIAEQAGIAFYFHDEGWIWFCLEDRKDVK